MDNYEDEIKILFNKLGIKYNLLKVNSTKKKDKFLSEKSINFLKEYFKEDFEIYYKYKQLSIRERLKF